MSFDLVSALSPTVTDAEARAAFLADPRTALAKAGLDLPEWFGITVTEGDAPTLALTLPPMLAEGELSETHLDNAAGGYCVFCRPGMCY
jgi:hypothetical protein